MPAAAPIISVSWRREREMIDQASRQHAPMQSNRRLTIVVAVVAAVVLLTSVASGDNISVAIGLVVGAAISGVLGRRERVRWVNMMADEGNTVMELGDHAVHVDGVILSEVPWHMVGRWRRTDRFLFLDYIPVRAVHPGGSMAAPLAAFTPEELSTAEDFLGQRIGPAGAKRPS